MKHLESQHQSALIRWSKYHPIAKDYLIAIPNGGYRNPREAARLKTEGVREGVSDLFLAYPTDQYHGLWIELKRPKPKGRVTVSQRKWLDRTSGVGYLSQVAYGFDHAKQIIEEYLNEK